MSGKVMPWGSCTSCVQIRPDIIIVRTAGLRLHQHLQLLGGKLFLSGVNILSLRYGQWGMGQAWHRVGLRCCHPTQVCSRVRCSLVQMGPSHLSGKAACYSINRGWSGPRVTGWKHAGDNPKRQVSVRALLRAEVNESLGV